MEEEAPRLDYTHFQVVTKDKLYEHTIYLKGNVVAKLLDSLDSWEVQAVSKLLHVFHCGFLQINNNEECF